MTTMTDSDTPKTIRQVVLDLAGRAVLADRNKDYGPPEDNFQDIADLWTAYLGVGERGVLKRPLYAHEVAILNNLQKVARTKTSPRHLDHWIDEAGYGACGAETAEHTLDPFAKWDHVRGEHYDE